jgi:hypothetical protein
MTVGIEVAVVDKLESITAVTDITDRIRVDHLIPSDTYPAIVVTMSSEEPVEGLEGLTADVYTIIEVQCIAESKTTARDLEWATRYGVTTQTGTAAGLADFAGTVGGLTIRETEWQGTSSNLDEPDDGKASPLYIMTGTYRINNENPG